MYHRRVVRVTKLCFCGRADPHKSDCEAVLRWAVYAVQDDSFPDHWRLFAGELCALQIELESESAEKAESSTGPRIPEGYNVSESAGTCDCGCGLSVDTKPTYATDACRQRHDNDALDNNPRVRDTE